MPLNFILGRAGAGKTHWCVDALRRESELDPMGPPLILLVPEQATHQTERALLGAGATRHAAMRARVLSFRRLASEVLSESGLPVGEILDGSARQMLLAALLAEARPRLKAFRQAAIHPGFVERLSQTLNELAAQRQRADALRGASSQLQQIGGSELLGAKAHDLALLLEEYRLRLEERYVDPQDTLDLAADRLAGTGLLRGATVWVDGFAGFTPQESEMLGAILSQAQAVWIALCLDPRELGAGGEARLFRPTVRTYWGLRTLAAAGGVSVEQEVCLPLKGQPGRFADAGPLAYLERAFGARMPRAGLGQVAVVAPPDASGVDAAASPPTRPQAAGSIRLVSAPDRRSEVAAAAAEIVRLSRKQGYAWRDMAIVVASMDEYHDLVRTTLADYGVPCFIDRRRPIPHHPVVEFLRSTLDITRGNWPADAVFRWLKTDLGPIDRAEVDELENYVIEHGLRGAVWTQEAAWDFWPRPLAGEDDVPAEGSASEFELALRAARDAKLAGIDDYRRRVAELLRPTVTTLAAARRSPAEVSTMLHALVDMLHRAAVPDRLAEWAEAAQTAGHPETAQEHHAAWRLVSRVLEGCHTAMGQSEQRLGEFAATLEAGLAALTLALVPPSLDQVVCGTIERSRQPDLKAVFLVGVDQGTFPGAPAEDQVFSDRDRAELAAAGLKLAESARDRSLNEEYLTYIALTRASERLWVSWPASADPSGGPGPSPLVSRLESLFCDLKPETPRPAAQATRPEQLASGVAANLSGIRRGLTPAAGWLAGYEWLVGTPERIARYGSSLRGWSWSNAAGELLAETARSLWRRPIRGSASRLEQFMRCPFAHFAAYGLRLGPRPRQQVRALEMGSFFHAVLQAFYQGLRRDGTALADLTEPEWQSRLDTATTRIAARLGTNLLSSSGQYRYLTAILGRTLRRTVGWLRLHEHRSAFKPVGVEMGFGLPGSPHASLDLGDVSLRGIIDRLDAAEAGDGRTLLRVVDYKSGRPRFDLQDVAYGVSLQLLTYLLAAPEMALELLGAPAEIAGLLLFPVQDPLISVDGPDARGLAAKVAKQWRPSGLVLADPEAVRLMDRECGEGSAKSLLEVRLGKEGQVVGTGAVDAGTLELLGRYLRAQVGRFSRRLQQGDVAIRPYRRAERRACDYCDFHALCAFDASLSGNSYRDLQPLPKQQAWEQIRAIAGEGQGGDGE